MMDPFALSESELITFLTELGIEDAVTMEPSERMRTMLNFMGEDGSAADIPPTNLGEQHVGAGLPTTAPPPAQGSSAHMDGQHAYAARNADHNMDIDDAQKDEHVASYCGITGADPDSARHLLEALNWDLEAAASMHMDQEHGDADSNTQASENDFADSLGGMNPSFTAPNFMGNPIAAGFPGGMPIHQYFNAVDNDDDQYGDYNGGAAYRMGGMGSNGPGGSGWANGGDHRSGKADEYDEEGVRKPDPIRHERMIGGMDDFDPYGRADTAEVTWLFPPPRHLSYSGPLQEARTIAKDDKKWMLVNIQSHLEFSSQMMNRDTFVDETVISLLRTSFVFWQRGHTSVDAINYMRAHHLEENDLPHMAVIDSRTGAKIVTMKGFISPGDLSMALLEFLEDNDFANDRAPKQRNIDATKDFERQIAIAEGRREDDNDSQGTIPMDDAQYDDYQQNCKTGVAEGGKTSNMNVGIKVQDPSAGLKLHGDANSSSSSVAADNEVDVEVDYGVLPEEPPIGDDPNVVKVSVKLPWGKQVVRRYHKTDLVQSVYSFAQSLSIEKDASNRGKGFDLCTAYPSLSLSDLMSNTIGEAGIAGSQVIMRWNA